MVAIVKRLGANTVSERDLAKSRKEYYERWHMTQKELKNKIIKKYTPGQIVNMRRRGKEDGHILKRFKAKILKFYPYHVSCMVNGYIESFTYWDMDNLTKVESSKLWKAWKEEQP